MTRISFILLSIIAAFSVTACAQREVSVKQPVSSGHSTHFIQGNQGASAAPLVIQKVEVPVAVPANLKKKPKKVPTPKRAPARKVIATANAEARQTSIPEGFMNAIQVFDYMPGALYELHTAPGFISTIALQPGETLISKAAGDTVRWVIGQTASGQGAESQTVVLVKPVRPGMRTNIVLTTSRRVYHIEAKSYESDQDAYNAAIAWNYPHDDFMELSAQAVQLQQQTASAFPIGVNPADLNFGYEISGSSPRWRPVRTFDDGQKTYIEFPAHLGSTQAPPLFMLTKDGGVQLVNYRTQGNYYIVDRLFDAAELRLGEDPQEIVRISRGSIGEIQSSQSRQPVTVGSSEPSRARYHRAGESR